MELRYLSSEDAQKALSDNLFEMFEHLDIKPNHDYLVAIKNKKAVGFAALYSSPQESKNVHIEMLEVAESARHQGIATTILGEIFGRAKRESVCVTHNGFTSQGQQYLYSLMNRLGNESGVDMQSIGRY